MQVKLEGNVAIVDVQCFVGATPEQVWAVLTDYEHAAQFISNLQESKVLSRTKDRMVVFQKGTVGFGPFTVEMESVREITLTPFQRTESSALEGSMKKSYSVTRLIPEAAGTRIVHHAESEPKFWIPPIIGPALIERETRARIQELLDEILKRKLAVGAVSLFRPGRILPNLAHLRVDFA